METIRNFFGPPDPQVQMRKVNVQIRSNIRKLDRDIAAVKQTEAKTRSLIIQADRRAQREPAHADQARREARSYASELIRQRRQTTRLLTAKAQLNSVQMQVGEAFALRRIEGSIRASVGIMHDINQLISLPQLAVTARDLGVELMKAGIIDEMVSDALPEEDDALLEDEAEGEVDKVLGEILKDRMATAKLPETPLPQVPAVEKPQPQQAEEEEDEVDTEAMMDQMRNRLEALKS